MVGKEDSRVVIVATGRVHCLGSENKREAAWASLLQPWAGHDLALGNAVMRHGLVVKCESGPVLCTV